MAENDNMDYAEFYSRFQAPIAAFDCGQRCAPHNEWGAPFCCDTRHAIPTAYLAVLEYLERHSDLWHLWQAQQPDETARLRSQAPVGQVLIACQGNAYCQRDFRSLTCRSFPFFPYLTRQGEFIGLAYYWEYEDRCWVISNLWVVTPEYRQQFIAAYDRLFEHMPAERENFRHYSAVMRRVFGRRRRALPLLHRNGHAYKITPRGGRMRRVSLESLPAFGPYRIAAEMPFPDEMERLR
jgi:hypothetical protein